LLRCCRRVGQVLEAAAWAEQEGHNTPPRSGSPSPEEELNDALKTLDALNDATKSADEVDFHLTMHEFSLGDVEVNGDHASKFNVPGQPFQNSEDFDAIVQRVRRPFQYCRSTSRSSSPPAGRYAVVDVAVSVAEAAASVAEVLLSAATASSTTTHAKTTFVQGILEVNSDLSVDPSLLQETCQTVLLKLLGPIAQVDTIDINYKTRDVPSFPSGGKVGDSGCAFEYEVHAVDPNDVELMRETLLLEAESGGARHLLPLLAEQIFDDGLPTPRHLKVRLDVQESSR